ncbi:hypothetical protein CERZMDRAFT_80668 [Cercospora zeae-maydis SCOH1-5]|uniref:Uncharacterized protein n=1 Tax=Cercospora zeae-maydis SCOH1-5 TaxID=717836 RepID=A0A6A6FXS9_9PEZI|nr:hypothetical protein CERZMDRAFT_80668 [Cercospora zeae-maydis SCOH1-5]
MIARTSFAALSSTERQLIRSQYLRAGKCARCFHSSRRRAAEEQRPEDGSPAIKDSARRAENNGPAVQPTSTKRARAQMISNELEMISKSPPPGNFTPISISESNQHSDPMRPSVSDGFTETPTSMGGGGQRMGENVSAGREGVNAQGIGRLTGTDERVRNEHPRPQATHDINQLQDPARGGASVLEASRPGQSSQQSERNVLDQRQEERLRQHLASARPQGLPFQPRKAAAEELLLQGRSAGTPTSSHPEAIVLDRYKLVTNPSHDPSQPSGRRCTKFSREDRTTLAAKLIAGKYDDQGVLAGEQVYKQAIVNELAKKTMINSTYLKQDGERFLKKVQSLLPAAQPARAASAPRANAPAS